MSVWNNEPFLCLISHRWLYHYFHVRVLSAILQLGGLASYTSLFWILGWKSSNNFVHCCHLAHFNVFLWKPQHAVCQAPQQTKTNRWPKQTRGKWYIGCNICYIYSNWMSLNFIPSRLVSISRLRWLYEHIYLPNVQIQWHFNESINMSLDHRGGCWMFLHSTFKRHKPCCRLSLLLPGVDRQERARELIQSNLKKNGITIWEREIAYRTIPVFWMYLPSTWGQIHLCCIV